MPHCNGDVEVPGAVSSGWKPSRRMELALQNGAWHSEWSAENDGRPYDGDDDDDDATGGCEKFC